MFNKWYNNSCFPWLLHFLLYGQKTASIKILKFCYWTSGCRHHGDARKPTQQSDWQAWWWAEMILPKAESLYSRNNKLEPKLTSESENINLQQRNWMAVKYAHRATPAMIPTQRKTASIKPNPIENQRRNHLARTSNGRKLFVTDQHLLYKKMTRSKTQKLERHALAFVGDNSYGIWICE